MSGLSRALDRPLRVLYLTHGAQLAGAELALVRLVEAFGDELSAHVLLAEDGPLVDRLRRAGARVSVRPLSESARGLSRHNVRPGAVGLRATAATVAYAASLERHLRRLRPDLVHVGSLKAGVYGAPAAKLAGIPTVWHVHDRIAGDYLPAAVARALRVLIAALPDAVVANSAATMATLHLPRNRKRPVARIIPYPIPAQPQLRARCPGPLSVGMVGRITEWKGQHVVLEAFARAFPTGSERLAIVGSAMFGEAEERYAAGLHDLACRLGIAERVEFRGFRENVTAELRMFDVLVHASVIPEPFGQVIAEGLAAGLPVVAASAGGAAEIIEHDCTGLLYRPGDAQALALALRQLAADPILRDRLSSAGRERIAEYSPDRIARRFGALYLDTLQSERRICGAPNVRRLP